MQRVITREVKTPKSFRVSQIAGMFDVPLEEKVRRTWTVELPLDDDGDDDWQIGAVVGPSGCGKSTIAQGLWPDAYVRGFDWREGTSILDNFPEGASAKEVISALTAVGFSSPPDWVKPYQALSTGQQMRADLARSLSLLETGTRPLVVFDEFTSVVDRTVAQIGSAAMAKAIRRANATTTPATRRRFVAVTCHSDVLDWLAPDWVYEPATGTFERRSLQRRPELRLTVTRVHTAAWELFRQYHYLSASLNPSARCYLAEVALPDAPDDPQPVGFIAVLPQIGFAGAERISRIVVLPDWQGVGVGGAFFDMVAELRRREGKRMRATASHPSIVWHCSRRPTWKLCAQLASGSQKQAGLYKNATTSTGRAVCTFEYVGPGPRGAVYPTPDNAVPARKASATTTTMTPKQRALKKLARQTVERERDDARALLARALR